MGDLIKYQDKNGNVYNYEYLNHKRTKAEDPEEYYSYDNLTGERLTTKIIRANGGIWELSYAHSEGKVYQKEVKDPYGNIITGNYENAPLSKHLREMVFKRDKKVL